MRIGATTPSCIADLWTRVEAQVGRATSLDEAAQLLVETLHREFEESVVLARVFLTVPFDALPPVQRLSVQRLAEKTGVDGGLRMATPVLSLVGTSGIEVEWCDRRQSRGHLGIPLISATFVEAIPMISGLLKELGVPLDWADTYDVTRIEKTIGRNAGLFFVSDAAEATDRFGRKIISAQDFVATHGVKAVFGVGGGYVSGQIVVLVVFCRDSLERAAAETFMALTALFKAKTAQLVGTGKIFSA
jgi:hypothetical protein